MSIEQIQAINTFLRLQEKRSQMKKVTRFIMRLTAMIANNRGRSVLVGLVVFATVCSIEQAYAVPLRVEFQGQISSVGSFYDPTGNFVQGDSLSGFWTLETTTPDMDPSASRGLYPQKGFPAFQINIGSSVFQSNSINIQILNDHALGIGTIDAYDVLAGFNGTSNISNLENLTMQITLRDTLVPLDVFDSDALPLFAPDPSIFDQFGQAQGQLTGRYNNQLFFMNLEVTSTTAVPEPCTLSLLTAGLLGVGILKMRKK